MSKISHDTISNTILSKVFLFLLLWVLLKFHFYHLWILFGFRAVLKNFLALPAVFTCKVCLNILEMKWIDKLKGNRMGWNEIKRMV